MREKNVENLDKKLSDKNDPKIAPHWLQTRDPNTWTQVITGLSASYSKQYRNNALLKYVPWYLRAGQKSCFAESCRRQVQLGQQQLSFSYPSKSKLSLRGSRVRMKLCSECSMETEES